MLIFADIKEKVFHCKKDYQLFRYSQVHNFVFFPSQMFVENSFKDKWNYLRQLSSWLVEKVQTITNFKKQRHLG
jgi:hypothetical protein